MTAIRGSEEWGYQEWGDPDSPGFSSNIVGIDFCGKQVNVHKDAAPAFLALAEVFAAHPYGKTIDDIADDWGWNNRPIGGTVTPSNPDGIKSNHAFGIAVDLNATRNPMRSGSRGDIPMDLVTAAEQMGFRWGGRYRTPDPMHFELLLTKDEVKERFGKDWLAMATEEQVREIVREEIQGFYRLLTTGDRDKAPNADKLNLRTIMEEVRKP